MFRPPMINALYSVFYHVYITYSRYMLAADACVVRFSSMYCYYRGHSLAKMKICVAFAVLPSIGADVWLMFQVRGLRELTSPSLLDRGLFHSMETQDSTLSASVTSSKSNGLSNLMISRHAFFYSLYFLCQHNQLFISCH